MFNPLLIIGALLGLFAVAMGAFTTHHLSHTLDLKTLLSLKTALFYNLVHAILVVAIGLALAASLRPKLRSRLKWSGWIFVLGIILFSFSIYLKALAGLGFFARLTPTGGVLLMLGWLSLVWTGLARS